MFLILNEIVVPTATVVYIVNVAYTMLEVGEQIIELMPVPLTLAQEVTPLMMLTSEGIVICNTVPVESALVTTIVIRISLVSPLTVDPDRLAVNEVMGLMVVMVTAKPEVI
jgi:hypothetical protein